MNEVAESIQKLACAVEKIAHGPQSGPTGLELLAIAIAGKGLAFPLGLQLERIATALELIAERQE